MAQLSQKIYQVSEFSTEVRLLLETSYPAVWIEGEISNLVRPASGHLYFTLKDEKSQLRCAFFRNKMKRLACIPEDGMKVHVKAQVSLYENRGDFQLIVSHLEPAGAGNLQAAFEKLKQKLKTEGLFETDYKKPLPLYPKSIGIITSATGAVIRDIVSTCERRYPITRLVLYPVQVQGESAAAEIIQALQQADNNLHDVLIIGRGGGSLEDLWAFNNERLARTIFTSTTPIISAVGHEVDFTIADLVADVRAPTPTAAAELATPEGSAVIKQFEQLQKTMTNLIKNQINYRIQQTDMLTYRIPHPAKTLNNWIQFNNQLGERLKINMTHRLNHYSLHINNLTGLLKVYSPDKTLKQTHNRLEQLGKQLHASMRRQLIQNKTRLETTSDMLITVSPQSTLDRGYAIVTLPASNDDVVRSVNQLESKSKITVRLADGTFNANRDD